MIFAAEPNRAKRWQQEMNCEYGHGKEPGSGWNGWEN